MGTKSGVQTKKYENLVNMKNHSHDRKTKLMQANKDQANANFFWEVSNLPCHSVTVKKLLTYEEHLCSSMF